MIPWKVPAIAGFKSEMAREESMKKIKINQVLANGTIWPDNGEMINYLLAEEIPLTIISREIFDSPSEERTIKFCSQFQAAKEERNPRGDLFTFGCNPSFRVGNIQITDGHQNKWWQLALLGEGGLTEAQKNKEAQFPEAFCPPFDTKKMYYGQMGYSSPLAGLSPEVVAGAENNFFNWLDGH